MRFFLSAGLIGLFGACHWSVTRADQDNFTLHAGSNGIEPFIAALERKLGTSAEAEDLKFPNSDPSRLYRLDGKDTIVIVNPVPDDRCNPNAPWHSTYRQGEYRIDLVYETRSPTQRLSARRTLMGAANEVRQTLNPFREC